MSSNKTADHRDKIPAASAYLRLAKTTILLVPWRIPLPDEYAKIMLTSETPETYKERMRT